ncbi:MAG: hypothetical protein ACRDYA_16065 [Egibacteraceae bacterium]
MSDDDLNLVHEYLDAEGRWQHSFLSPELQGAYEAGQADARDGSARNRLRDSSWQTAATVVSAYWLGYLSIWEELETRLPGEVRDLPGLAQHLHREAAWSAADMTHDDRGRPLDLESLVAFSAAMAYERAARLVDQLVVGHPDDDEVIWMPVDPEDEADECGGMVLTLSADPDGKEVRIRVDNRAGLSGERRFTTWWQAHTALGEFLHALDVAAQRDPNLSP